MADQGQALVCRVFGFIVLNFAAKMVDEFTACAQRGVLDDVSDELALLGYLAHAGMIVQSLVLNEEEDGLIDQVGGDNFHPEVKVELGLVSIVCLPFLRHEILEEHRGRLDRLHVDIHIAIFVFFRTIAC